MGFPANDVERVLLRASRQQADAGELLAALAGAELFVPVSGPPPTTDPTALQLPAFEQEGQRYVPVCTSDEQLQHYQPAAPHVRLRGRDLAGLLEPGTGLAVNARGDLGLPLAPEQVRALATGALPAGLRVRLGEPATEPRELLAAVAAALATCPPARAAYRALLQDGPDTAPRLVVGVEVDDPTTGSEPLSAVQHAARTQGTPVDVVLFPEAGDGGLGSWMQLHTRPFYRR